MRYYVKALYTSVLILLVCMGIHRVVMPQDADETIAVMGRPGDSGEKIVMIQTRLMQLGYDVGEISGRYDLATAEAVKRFQEDYGLEVSGSVNAETMYRLDLPIELHELCRYEERRFLASTLDAICSDSSYLTKVALAGMLLKRQGEVGFPDEVTAIVFGEPQLRDALIYDYGKEPSTEAWRAVRDAANGMSPCPDALYFYKKGQNDAFLSQLKVVFKNGIYYFAAPPAE